MFFHNKTRIHKLIKALLENRRPDDEKSNLNLYCGRFIRNQTLVWTDCCVCCIERCLTDHHDYIVCTLIMTDYYFNYDFIQPPLSISRTIVCSLHAKQEKKKKTNGFLKWTIDTIRGHFGFFGWEEFDVVSGRIAVTSGHWVFSLSGVREKKKSKIEHLLVIIFIILAYLKIRKMVLPVQFAKQPKLARTDSGRNATIALLREENRFQRESVCSNRINRCECRTADVLAVVQWWKGPKSVHECILTFSFFSFLNCLFSHFNCPIISTRFPCAVSYFSNESANVMTNIFCRSTQTSPSE